MFPEKFMCLLMCSRVQDVIEVHVGGPLRQCVRRASERSQGLPPLPADTLTL